MNWLNAWCCTLIKQMFLLSFLSDCYESQNPTQLLPECRRVPSVRLYFKKFIVFHSSWIAVKYMLYNLVRLFPNHWTVCLVKHVNIIRVLWKEYNCNWPAEVLNAAIQRWENPYILTKTCIRWIIWAAHVQGMAMVAQVDLFSLASLHTGTFKVPMNEALQQINPQTLCEQTLEYNGGFH